MSTIFGLTGGPEATLADDLRAMAAAVRDPGEPPELHTGEGFGLGAVGGRRPVERADASGVAIVADAALGARADLDRALGLDAAERRRLDDAQLILRAYLRFGERCMDGLVGHYAFALWDPRGAVLLCARDHIGARPLHWWTDGRRVVVASDPDVVLAHPAVERRVDVDAYLASVVPGAPIDLERSLWRGVHSVPPGQALMLSPEGAVRRRHVHWSPAPRDETRLATPEDYADALRDAIATATADAVRSPGPAAAGVGAHVTGGLDSSALAVLGHRALEREGGGLARAFSWAPPIGDLPRVEGDERPRAEAVAAQIGVPISFVGLDRAAIEEEAARARAMRPTTPSAHEVAVVRAAAREGVGVLLSGWGGDELASFNGRGVLARMARTGHWAALSRELLALSRRLGGRALPIVVLRALYGRVALPLLPVPVWRALRLNEAEREKRLRRTSGLTWADVHPRAAELAIEWREQLQRAMADGGRATQVELLRRGHVTARLESWALLGAEHGVEHRYPLLDRRVMDLCLSFPERLWLRDGWRRWLFRAAVEPLLPAGLAWSDAKDEPALVADLRPASFVAPGAAESDPELRAVAAGLARRAASLRSAGPLSDA